MSTYSFLWCHFMKPSESRINAEIERVIKTDRQIQFLLLPHDEFSFATVMRVKLNHPNKSISTIMVVDDDDQATEEMDFVRADRIWHMPENKPIKDNGGRGWSVRLQRKQQWIIDQSDCVICCWYADIEADNRLYWYLRENKPILDLTDCDIVQIIQQCIKNMTPEQQQLKTLVDQRKSHKEIGEIFGISGSAVRQRINRMTRLLRIDVQAVRRNSVKSEPEKQIQSTSSRIRAIKPYYKTCTLEFEDYGYLPEDNKVFVKSQIRNEIQRAINDGYNWFLTNFASEYELSFVQSVLDLKTHSPELQLEAVVPYGFSHKLFCCCDAISYQGCWSDAFFYKRWVSQRIIRVGVSYKDQEVRSINTKTSDY